MKRQIFIFSILPVLLILSSCGSGIFDSLGEKPKDGTWENDKVEFIVEGNGSEITYIHIKQNLLPQPYNILGIDIKMIRPKNAGFPIENSDVNDYYKGYINFSEIELNLTFESIGIPLNKEIIIKFKSANKSEFAFCDNFYDADFFSVNWVSSSLSVESTKNLFKIEILPDSVIGVSDQTMQLTCTAIYTDNSTQDVRTKVGWSILPETAGSINADGLLTIHATNTGTATIIASYKDQTDYTTLTVLEPLTVIDIDGNDYRAVKIGNQWWLAENLKVIHYRNGDLIANVTNDSEWSGLTTGACCAYNNDESNVPKYGRLYNWYAIKDSRKIAPEGWHVPTNEEWNELEMSLGVTDAGDKLKTVIGWENEGNGTNISGFSALPGGSRGNRFGGGNFIEMGEYASFWTSSVSIYGDPLYIRLSSYLDSGTTNKQKGFSVRLVKD